MSNEHMPGESVKDYAPGIPEFFLQSDQFPFRLKLEQSREDLSTMICKKGG